MERPTYQSTEDNLNSDTHDSKGEQNSEDKNPLEKHPENSTSSGENITGKLINGITDYLIHYLQTTFTDKLKEENLSKTLQEELTQRIDKTLLDLQKDPLKRHIFNSQIYNLLLPLLERKHGQIKVMIYEGLQEYSGEELTELIESKAGNDLQMIRINGSIVGGLVGILIYLLNEILI